MIADDRTVDQARTPPNTRNAWMITFADLLSLMLTFFVLLFSMTEVKVDSWQAVVEAFSKSQFPVFVDPEFIKQENRSIPRSVEEKSIDLGYLHAVLKDKYAENPEFSRTAMMRLEDRLVLSVPAHDLFDPGTADTTDKAKRMAALLVEVLGPVSNQVEIYGHSAPAQDMEGGYISAWEFTVARALAISRALHDAGFDREIPVIGFSESRFVDLSRKLTEFQRALLAQRVDVVIREP